MQEWKIKRLTFQKLIHRIRMIKSSSFMKLVLNEDTFSQCSNDDRHLKSKVKSFLGIIEKFNEKKISQYIQSAYSKVKQAGWKLIVEVDSEDDSEITFEEGVFSKIVSKDSTILPSDRTFVTQKSSFPIELPATNIIQEKENYEINVQSRKFAHQYQPSKSRTYSSSEFEYSRVMKKKKRAIILKKLENLQLCYDYLNYQSKRQTYLLGKIRLAI